MKLTKEQKAIIYRYIIDCISPEAYEVKAETDAQKLQFLADTFRKEYCYPENLKRYGSYQEVLRQWIMGLPSVFNVDFENYAIIALAKKWGSLPENATEKQEDKILENWFKFIAAKTLQMFSKVGIILH